MDETCHDGIEPLLGQADVRLEPTPGVEPAVPHLDEPRRALARYVFDLGIPNQWVEDRVAEYLPGEKVSRALYLLRAKPLHVGASPLEFREQVTYRVNLHDRRGGDRKSTRLNSSHSQISYAVFCLK